MGSGGPRSTAPAACAPAVRLAPALPPRPPTVPSASAHPWPASRRATASTPTRRSPVAAREDPRGIDDPRSQRFTSAWGLQRRVQAQLLDHQLWCLGCDIRSPEGNLLLAFGFERHRPPAGRTGSSAYRLRDAGRSSTIVCWGFGIAVETTDERLFLRRHPFLVEHYTGDARETIGFDLPARRPGLSLADDDAPRQAFASLARLWASYERWIASTAPATWRRQCWAERPRHVRRALRFGADELERGWMAMAGALLAAAPHGRGPLPPSASPLLTGSAHSHA